MKKYVVEDVKGFEDWKFLSEYVEEIIKDEMWMLRFDGYKCLVNKLNGERYGMSWYRF